VEGRGKVWGGGNTPTGGRVWEGARIPFSGKEINFSLEMAYFGAF